MVIQWDDYLETDELTAVHIALLWIACPWAETVWEVW